MLPCTTLIRHSRPSAPHAMLSTRVQMTCDDCHRAADGGVWPYEAEMHPVALNDLNPNRPHGKAYILVPEFAKHCAACHTLQFDKRFGNEQVPHDKPEA